MLLVMDYRNAGNWYMPTIWLAVMHPAAQLACCQVNAMPMQLHIIERHPARTPSSKARPGSTVATHVNACKACSDRSTKQDSWTTTYLIQRIAPALSHGYTLNALSETLR
jgi:hypothetical protein